MTFKLSFFLGIISLFFSCNNHHQESTINKPVTKPGQLNCYRYVNNRDTVILRTTSVNGSITGTLVYNFYEKDKNKGTIQGQMKSELLIADYTYYSEGVQSVRQIAFKKNGKTFIEGYGEPETKNGKTIFKNIDSLDFNHSIILNEIDCGK